VLTTLPSGTPAELVPGPPGSTEGLVIATDIWGLRPLYVDMANRLASEWGVTVCVPEPFPGLSIPMEPEPRFAAVRAANDAERLRDLIEAAAATGGTRVGLIGFCMGGMYALKAASLDVFARIVPFYGMIRVPESMAGPGQRQPLDVIAGGHPERVLAMIGELDPYTPPADVQDLVSAGVAVVRFPEASHAFVHDPARDSYRADDAEAAWVACRSWLTL
jgi:carboxymethylenebutenolidase